MGFLKFNLESGCDTCCYKKFKEVAGEIITGVSFASGGKGNIEYSTESGSANIQVSLCRDSEKSFVTVTIVGSIAGGLHSLKDIGVFKPHWSIKPVAIQSSMKEEAEGLLKGELSLVGFEEARIKKHGK